MRDPRRAHKKAHERRHRRDEHHAVWGSESRRCRSSRIAVLDNGAAEDAGAQESADFEVVHGDGWAAGRRPEVVAVGAVLVVVPLVGGQDVPGVGRPSGAAGFVVGSSGV